MTKGGAVLLIIEGLDGAGKTTFAQRLRVAAESEGNAATILHRGPPVRHPLYEYEYDEVETRLRTMVTDPDDLVIADRWHWGELVYGPVLRGASKLTRAAKWHVDAYLAARQAGVVYLDPPVALCAQRMTDRGDDLIKATQLRRLHSGYAAVYANRHLSPLRTWRIEGNTVENAVVAYGTLRLTMSKPPVLMSRSYVGPRQPRFVMVGDTVRAPKTGVIRENRPHRAAFVPYPSTSGEYLISALLEHGTRLPATVGLMNANDDEPLVVHDTWVQLGQPPLVALGQAAHKTLKSIGILHGVMPHPQYVRRFHHARRDEYIARIAYAAHTRGDDGKWPN